MPDTDQAAELAALRRRVLDMALGAFGRHHDFDENKPLILQCCNCEDRGYGRCWYRFCVVVERVLDLRGKVRHDIWLGNLDTIAAALYAAGERA